MKKVSKIVAVLLLAASVSTTAFAEEIPIESAPCNATAEGIEITETLISNELAEVQQGLGFTMAMARAQRIIAEAVINGQTQGYGYAELANIARNSLFQYRDMYLRPDYYEEQNTIVYSMIEDLIQAVAGGKPYDEALDEAYTRIYKSVDPSYEPNIGSAIDMAYLNVPAVDMVKFSRARKFLLEAILKSE